MSIRRVSIPFFILLAALMLVPFAIATAETNAEGKPCVFVLPDLNGGGTCFDVTGPIGPVASFPSGIGLGSGSTVPIDSSKTIGCAVRGDIPLSVATLTSIGGTFVPVSDAAVTRNTGYLVYKECVLDAVAAKIRQTAIAQLIDTNLTLINEGDNGNSFAIQNFGFERDKVASRVLTELAQKNYPVASVCGVDDRKEDVRKAVLRTILAQANEETKPGACTFKGTDEEYEAFLKGYSDQSGDWKTWWNFAKNPSNAPLYQYLEKLSTTKSNISQEIDDEIELIKIGDGYLSKKEVVQVPVPGGNGETRSVPIIKTLGSVHSQIVKNIVDSPLDQLEMMDEMDKIVDTSLAALTAKILSSPKGLDGITKPDTDANPTPGGGGSGQSYLDLILQTVLNLIQQTGSGSGNDTGNLTDALPALNAALAREQLFVSYRNQVLANLATTTAFFKKEQDACWVTIVQAVAIHANGAPFTPATTTQYFTIAVNDVVKPIETPMRWEINIATTSIAALQGYISTVTTSDTPATNAAALASLAQMQKDKKLHTAAEVAVAQQAITDIKGVVDTRSSATIGAWKQGSGWCNASSTQVVQSWFDTWKQ